MKRFLQVFILVGLSAIGVATAQQLPHYSQYMLNPYLINPAVGGTTDHYDLKAGFRQQWVGIKDPFDGSSVSPQTFYITGHGHIGKDHQRLRGRHKNQNSWHHGVGFQLIVDRTGPTSMNNFKGTYSYDLSISKGVRLSFGASLGLKTFDLNVNRIRLNDGTTGQVNVPIRDLNLAMPDMGVGVWLYHKLFYVGASVDQLFFNSFGKTIYQTQSNGFTSVNRLTQHYFVTAGGIFHPSKEIAIIPSILMKANYGTNGVSVDLNAKVRYNNLVWGGLSYRSSDAFVVLVGVIVNKKIEIGYSYDYTLSFLNNASSGSHEIMLGYRLEPRAHILSPSDFW